jgi:hypothetical protein
VIGGLSRVSEEADEPNCRLLQQPLRLHAACERQKYIGVSVFMYSWFCYNLQSIILPQKNQKTAIV